MPPRPHRKIWAVIWAFKDGRELGCYAAYRDKAEAVRLVQSLREWFPDRVVTVSETMMWEVT